MPIKSPATSIDEWYEDGCDELLEASTSSSRMDRYDTFDENDEKEVAMCTVSSK
jgi:hypothetical protein